MVRMMDNQKKFNIVWRSYWICGILGSSSLLFFSFVMNMDVSILAIIIFTTFIYLLFYSAYLSNKMEVKE